MNSFGGLARRYEILAHIRKIDVRDLLPKVRAPTLIVHYRNDRIIPFEAGRELAAGIQGARFVPLEGDAHIFYFGDTRPLRRAIAEFLGDPIEEFRQPQPGSSKLSSTPEAVQGTFRREGEFWTIASWGEVFRLKDVRGLAYIAYLLGHPGEEFHVLSLAGKQGDTDALAEPATEEQATQSDLTVGRMGDAGEMLDAQAKAAYRRRTAELREQLEEARELNQLELVGRLEDEIEAVGRELSRAVGLGGRDRRAASASERARINVTRAIKIALERDRSEHSVARDVSCHYMVPWRSSHRSRCPQVSARPGHRSLFRFSRGFKSLLLSQPVRRLCHFSGHRAIRHGVELRLIVGDHNRLRCRWGGHIAPTRALFCGHPRRISQI
jgi:hypothetical protein